MLVIIVSALLFFNVIAKNEEYIGHRVYNIKLNNQDQQDTFYKINSDLVDFWRKPSLKYDITGKAMVPLSYTSEFEKQLAEMDVAKDIAINDVYKYLTNEEQTSIRASRNNDSIFDFESYHRYDAILEHLYKLRDAYENSTISLEVIEYGKTEENRPIVYVKITNTNDTEKPVVVLEAGSNPREWITIPSALYVVDRILENQRFLSEKTWIVIPVLNPDGYEYTHTNLRLWQKSRSQNSNLGFICPGVNLDRNFDIDWLVSDSSSSPCSHLYAGVESFSEIESRLIKDLIETYKPEHYISIKSNGKFVTYPWSFEKAASGLFVRHYLLGLKIIADLNDYKQDAAAFVFGDRESGTSTDYARMNRVFYTFNVGVDGDDGIFVSEENIKSKAEDVWRAISVITSSSVNY